jgi:next to BRCA1 gene 1 protein
MNLSALRARIDTAFKFGPDVDFVLTYTDEDGDIVMLDDDDDLRDAALRQRLNPLRITVQLKKNQPTEKRYFCTSEIHCSGYTIRDNVSY